MRALRAVDTDAFLDTCSRLGECIFGGPAGDGMILQIKCSIWLYTTRKLPELGEGYRHGGAVIFVEEF